ncbi:MAG: ATP synthase F1 subunit gamma [Candidatus Staskawiczbacteria bacterium RIFCSPLOWO2_12_FULL_37_15]|uniref:ATP synthase gamma chain n=1 Tax=Candidatus Staskawiczbacteria bacterium RIFCSPLOWO2_12_FULL_37_15 TaxID=1802218 RepID=A0A1G2IS70_9BACT|nr:MAG: ATP synthase gamma chain [Parcubacteria group bacterium GW2011_GWA2_37_10]OGZ77593.1 MAG: ATP synthase F1 subunit gamma [Candidatus Staskawiczbacteria bacterium RIFCSPLOWO2_12_FULL_37_15]
MESPQNIKKRLKSVNNINQITKAMELVSATKMRKSQQVALDSRPYSFAALELLANVSVLENLDKWKIPLFEVREKNPSTGLGLRVLFVLVASDKGLAGAFNSSVFKKFETHIKEEREEWKKEEHLYLAIGQKAYDYLSKKFSPVVRTTGLSGKVLKKFVQVGDYVTPEQVKPITDFIIDGYLGNPSTGSGQAKWDRVIVISTHFRSALKQEPHVRRILPIDFDHVADTIKQIIPERGKFADLIKEQNISFIPDKVKLKEYTIEPAPEKVLEKIAQHLFFMQMYHLILEANASEHSARRMAMKTASDNASDLGEKLNLQYNKSRQSKITTEIAEISAGAEALN